MHYKNERSGLCGNCAYHPDCYYEKNHSQPILFCEEFQCMAACNRFDKPSKDEKQVKPSKSICSNCDLKGSCALQTDDSSITFCEAYI